MTLQLSTNGATHQNAGQLAGAPAVLVSGTGITFINLPGGLVSSSQNGQAAIRLTQGGNNVINRADGAIASFDGTQIAIEGSAGADTIDNAGSIAGRVALGGGNDTYILRHSPSTPLNVDVDLGDGDDTARFIVFQNVSFMAPQLAGGSGTDTLHLEGPISHFFAATVTGFERLVLDSTSINIDGFSGLNQITLAPGARANFINSQNPLVDLAISGGFISLANGSTVRSVTGSGGSDYLELGFLKTALTPVSASIDLGGGDDFLYLTLFDATQVIPGLPPVVQGGAGSDSIYLSIPTGATVDMAKFSGFEVVDTGTFTSITSQVRLINLSGFQRVSADQQGSLTIGQTNAPGLLVVPSQGSIVIEQAATIGAIGYPPEWSGDWLNNPVAQPGQGITVTNSGTIVGNVQLGLGNDLYDGENGSLGGTVFGYAGNDTIKGGSGAETILGGYGADTISGGGGADRIDGGPGSDSLTGGTGADTFVFAQRGIGDDTIHDFTAGDRIDLSGIGIPDFQTLQRFMAQSGSDVVITLGYASASETILIRNVSLAALGPADFVFDTSSANRFLTGTAGDDLLFGGAGQDNLLGGGGNDRLIAGPGNDLLDGGSGSDEMIGGDGNDVYFIDSPGDVIVEVAGGGTDTVVSSISYTLGAGLEVLNLTGSGHVDGTGEEGRNTLAGNGGDNVLRGLAGDDDLNGQGGNDRLEGGAGNDYLDGGIGVDTAVLSGNRNAYVVTQTGTTMFSVTGPDGTDSLTNIEFLQFADQTIRLYPGTGTTVNFAADDPATYMAAIRDFDGNDVGAASDWKRIGAADVNGDGDLDQIFVNRTNGRFAEVGTAPDGKVYFSDHGWAGETRVVGIYIDPLVQSGQVQAGSDFDSQKRFQNDLKIGNIAGVLGAGDYDKDGLQEVYFKLTDGTAYLHAYMHADGNIRYANYQSQQQVIDFLTQNGWASSTWDGWFG